MSETLRKLNSFAFYARYALEFVLLRREAPLMMGLALTDRCVLSCRHCRVANTGKPDMTMEQVQERLNRFYHKGCRELYITGGEPFLWEDGDCTLEDVVAYAKRIGYFHVTVSTNGLCVLESSADMLWVSLDGLKKTYARIRGDHFDAVINHIKTSTHPKIGIVYTVNSINRGSIYGFLEFVRRENLTKMGVMFYFHTPYYGVDELFVSSEGRRRIVDEIIRYKRTGLPVYNSYAGLKSLKEGSWQRPNGTCLLTDIDGDYICCRHRSVDLCRQCGYSSLAEISEAQRLRPSALMNLLRVC